MSIKGYDQWKTASPYDDDPDFIELGWVCPHCGSDDCYEWMDTTNEGAVLICDQCEGKSIFSHDATVAPTLEQLEEINQLQKWLFNWRHDPKRKYKRATLAEFFQYAPEGDFKWEDTEAGDWHVYRCGEKDCPQQWHLVAYAINMGRENGKHWVDIMNVDDDGNWDYVESYDEREADKAFNHEYAWGFVAEDIASQSDDYFYGWAQYWLEAALTGKDPCEQFFKQPHQWVEECLKAARDNVRYLRKDK